MSDSETRIHVPDPLRIGETLELDGSAQRHLRARRLRTGDALAVFNGNGGEYRARIICLERRRAVIAIDTHSPREAEPPRPLALLQGIAKGDRMDMAVQKAVELGVTHIVPVFTRHSVVRLDAQRAARRRAHWQRIAISACEQCGRNRIPEISDPAPLAHGWTQADGLQGVILDQRTGRGIQAINAGGRGLALLVGPEGGLSAEEMKAAAGHGFARLALGPRVLRTETAALAAIALLQARFGDMGGE